MIARGKLLRRSAGPLVVLCAIAVLELVDWAGWAPPTVGGVLLPLVILTTLLGGLGAGLLSAAISCVYYFTFYNVADTHWLDQVSQRAWASSALTLLVVPIIEILRRRLVAEREWTEAALDRMLETSGDAFVVLDDKLRTAYINRAAEAFWNRPRDELLGERLWEAFPHMAGSTLEQKLRQAAERQEATHFETSACVVGRWIEARAWPARRGVSILFQDVTEGKSAEALQSLRLYINEQLRVQEDPGELLDAAAHALGRHLHAARVVYMEVNPETREFVVQHEYRRADVPALQRRWQAEEAADRTLAKLERGETLCVEDADTDAALEPVVRRVLEQMEVKGLITVPLLREGHFAASLSVHSREPRRWPAHEITLVEEVAGWTRQALERVRAEQALRESQNWLYFTLAATRVGTWDWKIATGEVRWSENMDAIHGLDSGAFDHRIEFYFEHVHVDDRDRVRHAVNRALEHDQPYYSEYRVVGSDGAVRWIEAKGRVVYDEDGKAARMAGICTEITERKQTEGALQTLNETLEQRVEQRTAEIRRLARELSEAEQRERAHLARVLHDHLQQFLVAAKMRVGMLRRRIPEEAMPMLQEAQEVLSKAIDESRSLAVELSPPILQQQGLLAAVRWLAHQQQTYGLSVEVVPSGEVREEAFSEAARNFLFQAIRELLLNVAKHAATDHATVELVASDEGIRVTVADEGRGCDPAGVLEAHQVESTGFGLASIKHRLELLGGSFEMISQPWQGTRTTLWVAAEPQ